MPDTEDTPILQMVQTLPENYRQAIYLRYYEEYELDEIAALMGCKTAQVSTYLYRGRAKLKTMLGGNYGQECLSE
jgi:RNA polymerase sigma-70 factor (ECF subfamily)